MTSGRIRNVSALVVLLLPALASAAAEASHAAEGHVSRDWGGLAFAFINFSLFLIVLRRFAWPAVQDFLQGRRREIAEAMSIAARAVAEAEQIRREYAAKEAALGETCRKMVEEIREGAALDRQRALAAASEAAERMKADADRQAASELARARRELRAEAARLAAQLAEVQIRERLDVEDRSRLIKEFVAGVSRA